MKKGSGFEREGQSYEILQDGVDFVKGRKSACIRRKGAYMTIETAIAHGYLRSMSSETTPPSLKREEALFSNGKTDRNEKENIEVKYNLLDSVQPASGPNTFFMSVDPLRAQVFLAHGLIYPAIYDKAGVATSFEDVQKSLPDVLILFPDRSSFKQTQLLLEVLVHPDEVSRCVRTDYGFNLSAPLPISRLKSIGVPRQLGDVSRYVEGWVKPDVPVSKHLFSKIDSQVGGSEQPDFVGTMAGGMSRVPETEEASERFDRYMGLLAFLRNADRYFSEVTGRYADYPEDFHLLAASLMREPTLPPQMNRPADSLLLALLDKNPAPTPAESAIIGLARSSLAYIDKEAMKAVASDMYGNAGQNEDLAQAFKMLFSGDYRSATQILRRDDMPKESGILSALYKFSDRQSNDHRNVKQRLHEDWKAGMQAVRILGVLGAYYGYTALDARETHLYSVHPLIRPALEANPPIKFHLESSFERRLIEALYQWAFHRREPDRNWLSLYSGLRPGPQRALERLQPALIADKSYRVQDVEIRRYEVTDLGLVVQQLKSIGGEWIDETSCVGKYLLWDCFFLADEYEISKKGGRELLRYRMSKNKLIHLIVEQKIKVHSRVLQAAIDADSNKSRT